MNDPALSGFPAAAATVLDSARQEGGRRALHSRVDPGLLSALSQPELSTHSGSDWAYCGLHPFADCGAVMCWALVHFGSGAVGLGHDRRSDRRRR